MILGRVVGNVVTTRKSPRLEGFKILVVVPVNPDGTRKSGYIIAIDAVGAGAGELVLTVAGSSSREDVKTKRARTDTTIIAIVDDVNFTRKREA